MSYRLKVATFNDSAETVREIIKDNARVLYRNSRRGLPLYFSAYQALLHARNDAIAGTLFPMLEREGLARLEMVPDELACLDDLAGDVFNPDVNDDIPRERLEREYKEFVERVNSQGVWGIVGQWRSVKDCAEDNDDWQGADSCFGFVGDDWQDSGYDSDIKRGTIDALIESVFAAGDGTPDLFAADEVESVLLICRDARRKYLSVQAA